MADDTTTGLSHIKRSPKERKKLADQSVKYNMDKHKNIWLKFTRFVDENGETKANKN
jgi:hypothetical protein